MTREEAIAIQKAMRDNLHETGKDYPYRDYMIPLMKESCDIAIQALEQEPCDDAISRQDTLKTIIKHLGIRSEEYLLPAEEAIYKVVKNMPSVTPQQKVGKWMIHPNGVYAHLVCSKCLTNAPYDCKTNYCPNCGAKMEVE